jgi:hypothetical protein
LSLSVLFCFDLILLEFLMTRYFNYSLQISILILILSSSYCPYLILSIKLIHERVFLLFILLYQLIYECIIVISTSVIQNPLKPLDSHLLSQRIFISLIDL